MRGDDDGDGFDLGARFFQRRYALLAAHDLIEDAQAVLQRHRIGLLGFGHQLLHFQLELGDVVAGPPLNDSLVPIRLGEKVVAYLQTGQVLFRSPTEKQFRVAMKQILQWNPEANAGEFHTAFFQSRVLTKAHYDAMLRLLSSFAQHLSLVVNELMITQTTAEPPAVTKARGFIAENLGEELSLAQVAQAACMSAFYFCKVFKAAAGVTFTDYVARARVEKTKQLLCNSHTRVSEAAFEAGFQSLSQFNRVFRRIEGQSLSTYREHLHGASRSALAYAA